MAVTIYDIARELNISAMTVSRVLNQPERSSVSAGMRERVLKTANAMGYQPNRHARALITGKTSLIAIWISHLHSSIYMQIARACQDEAQRDGFQANIYEMNWHFPKSATPSRLEWAVDGILAVDPPPAEIMGKLLETAPRSIPRVNLGTGDEVAWTGDYVHVDLRKGVRQVIQHLIDAGCKRIAYSVLSIVSRPSIGNYDPYAETMQAAGLPIELIVQEQWDLAAVRAQTKEYIGTHGKPDAIFCHNDELAIATFRALRDLDYRVPEDVLLVGCEGNEFMEYFDPPLSTIELPTRELAKNAWSLLLKRIQGADVLSEGISLPYNLQFRRSSER